ncbi:unnamed protein product [Cuscuta epithymum]|uniref:Polymerase nucleotidyl transferase domain-containing protein n=1 Tax=Cuscuta epithymum TaxID=186058 RepID=A0AAV0D4Y1_9ASTE|nr:unnamed protein product [Cuscuta epithymum]
MGEEDGGWAEQTLLLPNGLLANAEPVIQGVDPERWLKAEETTAKLIARIQPNKPSEERRNAVADYVQRLIAKCFPCQVFTFGSVPLKTYLPDGDIDLTAFSDNQSLKDTWAHQVRDTLEKEEKNENAEFRVKEVQYIQAEVKLIKCLVENIVVDISFNQLGGLCTLCFLEEVDHLISQNHLFKRSIILIKAWCYYESRILGAHHGLISTYALETLVLYIFHVFNKSFTGPLEVLYRFLEFFSNFDWDNFCVSLWGPVPIRSLPDVNAEPPRKDSGELLLTKGFLDACSTVYAVFPGSQENPGQPFASKHFNVIDPLRVNNNLGRSVSKGNFFRIRSAFTFGAKRLSRLLDCPKENLIYEINQFFLNTWERYGIGGRPDAPASNHLLQPDNMRLSPTPKKVNDQTQRSNLNLITSRVSDQVGTRETDRSQRSSKSETLANGIQGRFVFARTQSSPELIRLPEGSEMHSTNPTKPDNNNNNSTIKNRMMKNARGSENSTSNSGCSIDAATNSNSGSNHDASGLNEELSSTGGTRAFLQEEEQQDVVNMMASTSLHDFNNGQQFHHLPFNITSPHLPFPIPPSFLASMGYPQRNMPGFVPANFSMGDSSFSNVQFPHALMPQHMTQYFSGLGLSPNPEDAIEPNNQNFITSTEMYSSDAENEFWPEHRDTSSTVGNFETNQSEDQKLNFVAAPSWVRYQPKQHIKENHWFDHHSQFFQDNGVNNNEVFCAEERMASSRLSSTAHSKASSESSWDGSSAKSSKSVRDRRGKKAISVDAPSIGYGMGKMMSQSVPKDENEGDEQDWSIEVAERGGHGAQTSGSDSMIPIAPMLINSSSQQRLADNSPGVIAFYPTGPPVPFFTMLPVYNIPPKEGISRFGGGEGSIDNSDSGQNFDSSSEVLVNHSDEQQHKSDILNSDFASHWQNLQYGRFCQSPRYPPTPLAYPSPMMVPPVYLQGRFPWDGPGRPASTNTNLFTELMSYGGPRLVPVSPVQSVPDRPANMFQRYADEIPRYRSGTGTYLPNHPKVSARDRSSSGTRRGSYNNERSDNGGDREGNWNSKTRGGVGRGRNSTTEKSNARPDRFPSSDSRMDRPWNNSYRNDSFHSYPSQNGPMHASNSNQSATPNVAYGMYPLSAMNTAGVSTNGGPSSSPVVMMYPSYDHHPAANYGSQVEPLEFGSFGPVGFSGMNEQPLVSEGARPRAAFEHRRFHGQQQSSPDQPSSPCHQRRG